MRLEGQLDTSWQADRFVQNPGNLPDDGAFASAIETLNHNEKRLTRVAHTHRLPLGCSFAEQTSSAPHGRRLRATGPEDLKSQAHTRLARAPLGVSSMTQPLAFSSSRRASARLKSLVLRAAWRASTSAVISAGTSTSLRAPTPSTESSFSQVPSAAAAAALGTWEKLDSVLGVGALKEVEVPAEITALVEARQAARKTKDFKRADALRDELKAKGWVIEDTPKGARAKRV